MGNASAFEMDALDTRIRELIAYARERDGEDRTLLFRNLIDLFLTGKAPQKQPTRDQLLDVIEALVPHVEPEGRRTVAELVANMSEPPLDLACRLAKDRPHLVGDLLRSASFEEDEIIELINCTGRDHHHVIASRNDLSANVWIALARATPATPGFDTQSTLALWRDDLGLGENSDAEPKITPFRATRAENTPDISASTQAAAHTVPPEGEAAESSDDSDEASPRGGKPAQLRILRTDKDLIADRIEKSAVKMQTSAELKPALPPIAKEHPEPAASTERAAEPSKPDAPILLSDPDGGGWRWRSDREGLLLEVSPSTYRYFAEDRRLTGVPALDILGLSEKLGHPVSKAFQRRSTIHDAPLTLATPDDANRFWTLEATPLFSANGGIFEGYEGVMMPVTPATDTELPLETTNTAVSQPLFRDDMPPADEVEQPTPSTPKKAKDTIVDESIDRTLTPPPAEKQAYRSDSTEEPIALPGRDELMAIAADMIKDMVGNSVTEALEKTAQKIEPVQHPAPQPAEVETPSPSKANDDTRIAATDEIAATLHILEQALSTLVISGQTANNSALRLQTEIASACLKTLKEQIGAHKKPG